MIKMRTKRVDDYLKEELKDPYFKELWELEEQKLNRILRHSFWISQVVISIEITKLRRASR